ncbi:MAG: peptidylprolyl isomerase [Nanoarchaeota archaeon]|nr:peptidylprolyl isomerase [Nanoarchaeota archaeon]
MKKIQSIAVLIILLFLTSCGGTEKLDISGTSSNVGGTPPMKTAVLDTNLGTIEIELFTEKTPETAQNFITLAEKGFFDGTKFHRVIAGFMIQGGDPLSKDDSQKYVWGTGGPGYEIKDEFVKGLSNVRGTISMANHGPNTGGSQFFISMADNTFLDFKHAVFGKVTKGMDIVDKIGNADTDSQDKPVEDVVVEKVTIK